MAVDTRNKRASMVCLGLPFGRVPPNPDGSLATAADRAQLNYLYALGGAAPPATFNPVWASHANQLIGPVLGTP
jgi:hypothetical protein